MSFDYGAVADGELVEFLTVASRSLEADFACLHLLTPNEIQRGRERNFVSALDKRATKFDFGVYTQDLKKRLPDLFWLTVFGAPYVRLFGREKLLSAPASKVESVSDDIVLLQLSDSLTDVEQLPRELEDVRLRVKSHLGHNAFFEPGLPTDHNYRAPQFIFGTAH
jgi:hypothetical protein